jgi:erythromycin esterase-like protein
VSDHHLRSGLPKLACISRPPNQHGPGERPAVLGCLDEVDPDAARVARARYAALTPWQKDPAAYGRAVLVGRYTSSESAVVGQLCRAKFGDAAYIIGFGTDHGTVAAASNWDEPMQRMQVRPAHPESYEHICHDSELPAFMLPLSGTAPACRARRALAAATGARRPDTELQSHYFHASLPRQFDEFVWFDASQAVTPLEATPRTASNDLPDTFPFGI